MSDFHHKEMNQCLLAFCDSLAWWRVTRKQVIVVVKLKTQLLAIIMQIGANDKLYIMSFNVYISNRI